MKKIFYEDIKNQQLVDVRTQHGYQEGHIKNSLNLNPSNFKTYATYYLDVNQPVIFIVGSEEEAHLEELSELVPLDILLVYLLLVIKTYFYNVRLIF